MDILIFSKDRACQLELLLRSIRDKFVNYENYNFVVLYKTSNENFKKGYELLKKDYNEFLFLEEIIFEKDVNKIVNNFNNELIMFLVDDNVFKEEFDYECDEIDEFKNNEDIYCLSLRLGTHLNLCYPFSSPMMQPTYIKKYVWNWKISQYDYNYPLSLDGHIFKKEDFMISFDMINFSGPNYLESELSSRPINKQYMMSFEISKIINIPNNRVQNEFKNRSGNISNFNLNERYLNGERIITDNIYGIKNKSCHQEIEFILEKQISNDNNSINMCT